MDNRTRSSAAKTEDAPRRVRSFVLWQIIFWSPVIFVLGAFEFFLWRSGETWSIEHVVAAQEKNRHALFMRDFIDQALLPYKFETLAKRQPRVLAIGSSRVMKLRHEMFGLSETDFYNSGGAVQNLSDLNTLVERLPKKAPQVVVLGVDMWWFNPQYAKNAVPFGDTLAEQPLRDWKAHLGAIRGLVFKPKILRATLHPRREAIGLGALARSTGFRYDGSLRNGEKLPVGLTAPSPFVDRNFNSMTDRVRNGTYQFVPCAGLSRERLQSFRSAIKKLQARGIFVCAFSPPIASEAAAMLQKGARSRQLWVDYEKALPELCAELKVPFFNAATPVALGLSDVSMVDGIHGEETLYLHLLRQMLRDARVAAALPAAPAAVEKALASPRTNLWYPDFGEKQ